MLGSIRNHLKRFDATAEVASMIYLALPVLLFLAGWLRPLFAVVTIAGLLLGAVWYTKYVYTEVYSASFTRHSKRLIVVIAACLMLGWVLISGIGGLTPKTGDFNKHDAILSDLTLKDWPVLYHTANGDKPLVYYVAYYLPAAAVGKLAPSHHVGVAQYALLGWSLIGILLVFYWLSRLAGKSTILLALLFIGFSGMDVIGSFITHTADNPVPLMSRTTDLEWYAGPANIQYSSNTTSLFWAPQHAIVGWLLAGMLAAIFVEKRGRGNVIFLGVLAVLWSPLIVIGLLPFYACLLLDSKQSWRKAVSLQNTVVSALLLIVFGLYFLAGSGQSATSFLGYTVEPYTAFHKLCLVILFILIEFGVYSLLIAPHVRRKESAQWQRLFLTCVAFLTILPFFRLGIYNDLVMRASIPSLLIISVLVYRFLAARQTTGPLLGRQQLLIMCLSFGLISPFVELNTHLLSKRVPVDYWYSIGNPAISAQKEPTINQYLGDRKAVFYKHLARD